ncbi:hypothetical protein [Polyangium fumosum]|uniref:DUF3352 domain-containing protein n=1 Tax=Polyangium fumosum TaxID=889272 RepID=A0A4U1JJT8_9BACT|nr:hypothetical protein [Polyangium fumosum]TKD13006.1 hypothetical protein E8A74_00115 [Polyangium fumosum]
MAMRRVRGLFFAVGLSALVSCGGAAVQTPPETGGRATSDVAVVAPPAPTTAPAPAKAAALDPPQKVDSLLRLVPRDAVLVANVPPPEKALAAMDPALRAGLLSELAGGLSGKLRLAPALVADLVKSFEGAVVFAGPATPDGPPEPMDRFCYAARMNDGALVTKALDALGAEKMERGIFVVRSPKGLEVMHGAWIEGSRALVGCLRKENLRDAFEVGHGRAPSVEGSALLVKERAGDPFVAVDLHGMGAGTKSPPEPGSRLFVALVGQPQGLGLDLRFSGYGPDFPALGSVLDAAPQVLMPKLPEGALAAIGLSTERSSGKTVTDVLEVVLGRSISHDGAQRLLKRELGDLGIELADFEKALGGEVVVGLYRDPKQPFSFDDASDDPAKDMAALVVLSIKDAYAQKTIFSTAQTNAKGNKKVTAKGDSFTRDSAGGTVVHIESRPGFVVLGLGNKKVALDAVRRFGKDPNTLATNPAFLTARAKEKAASHMLLFFDPALARLIADPTSGAKPGTRVGGGSMLSLVLFPSDRGLELAATGDGAAELLGIGAALAVNGVRRYTASAKAVEARSTVSMLARAAVAAYEREQVDAKPGTHRLCKSATPVPSVVPRDTTYLPSGKPGQDFEQGDTTSGWRCLQVSLVQPIRYQYEYRAGGNYKGPKRGGPDPGKDGFEVSAEGDLDGDGKTSLFTMTGKIQNGTVVLSTQMFLSDQLE